MFASLQSSFGQQVLEKFHLPADNFNSFILYEDEKIYKKSEGALKVFSQLLGWRWVKVFFIVPKFIRDGVYDLIARNRYKWFGKRNECMIPTPDLKARFLD